MRAVLPYVWAICIAMMYTCCREQAVVCSFLMCAVATGVYMLVYSVQKRPIGAKVVTAIMSAACFGSILLVSGSFADYLAQVASGVINVNDNPPRTFLSFLFSASAYFDWVYAVATILMFGIIIGFISCYFSAVLPRMCFLLLPSFVPLILAARTAQGLPLWLLMLVYGTFIPAVCCSAHPSEDVDAAVFGVDAAKKNRLVGAFGVGLMAILVAVAIPRGKETLFSEHIDLMGSGGFYRNFEMQGSFAASSSTNKGANDPDDDVLFTVITDVPKNLDRWTFDCYNGTGSWYSLEDYNTGYPDWQTYARHRSYHQLFSDIINGVNEGRLSRYADIFADLPRYRRQPYDMYISVNGKGSQIGSTVVMHPLNSYSAELVGTELEVYRTAKGELFVREGVKSMQTLVSFYYEYPYEEYAAALQQVDFALLLADASAEGVISGTTANAFADEYVRAMDYAKRVGTDGVSAEVQALAAEITADCETDLDKFNAIEHWFSENGFVYDLEFVPKSAQAEYFLFESKRGICSDYASAATLLARAAGLPARYTEGFSLTPDCLDDNGVYNVTAAQAHAYSQVYVKGCGWLNLDPTKYVPAVESVSYAWVIAVCALGLAVVLLLCFLLRKQISRAFFALTYPLRSPKSRVMSVYSRTREIACALGNLPPHSTSCGETRRIIGDMLSLPSEAEKICTAADELMYSEKPCTADTKELYRCYRRICKRKRVLKR